MEPGSPPEPDEPDLETVQTAVLPLRLPSIFGTSSRNSTDQATEEPAKEPGKLVALAGSQMFDFSVRGSALEALEAPSKRTSLQYLPAASQTPSSQPRGSRSSLKSARLAGLAAPGPPGAGTRPDLDLNLAPDVASFSLPSPGKLTGRPQMDGKDGTRRGTRERSPLPAPDPVALPEMMRMSSRFQGELPELTATKKKRSWKRERLRGLVSTGQSISGIPPAVEWILPPVFSADPSMRKTGIFNSPAEIGKRLKARSGKGRSRQSAASIPIDTGTCLADLH